MSSRIRSEFGTLEDRNLASGHAGRVPLPCHVWAWLPGATGWTPGLLTRWEPDGAGGWLGEVALVGESGAAALYSLAADRLRPVQAAPPLPWA